MADRVTGGSSLRRDQARAVRERIVSAAVAVIEAGDEPTMRAVAQAAEISERTLFRYFASRDELLAALSPALRGRASTPMADDVEALPDYVRRLFSTFDQNARLTRALATAKWWPAHVTRSENLEALRKIIDAAFPRAPRSDRASAAASLRVLYSAVSWVYLADCGFDVAASIRHVQWNTKKVLEELRRLSGGHHA
jgi:AcrR family transcriptional regulator